MEQIPQTPPTRPINPYEDVRSDAPTVIVPQVPLVVDFDGFEGQNLFNNFTPESKKSTIPASQAKTISFDDYLKSKIDELPTPQRLQFGLDTAQAKDEHLKEQIESVKRKYDTQINPYDEEVEKTSKAKYKVGEGGRRSKKRKTKKRKTKKRKTKKRKSKKK
jgi:hypothetical protein